MRTTALDRLVPVPPGLSRRCRGRRHVLADVHDSAGSSQPHSPAATGAATSSAPGHLPSSTSATHHVVLNRRLLEVEQRPVPAPPRAAIYYPAHRRRSGQAPRGPGPRTARQVPANRCTQLDAGVDTYTNNSFDSRAVWLIPSKPHRSSG